MCEAVHIFCSFIAEREEVNVCFLQCDDIRISVKLIELFLLFMKLDQEAD
jgi:hypothetical protein